MNASPKRMAMKRYKAWREKLNALLECYIKNNIHISSLNESVLISNTSQISGKDLNDITTFSLNRRTAICCESHKLSEQCVTPRGLQC